MTQVLVSIGSNLKKPEAQVLNAFHGMSQIFSDIQMSQMYLTEPVGPISQHSFVNAAISFETNLEAPDVLKILLELENRAGRDRQNETPKGPRVLDIDIILFGGEMWSDEVLLVPHPRYQDRRFVLAPALEIAAQMIDPVTSKTIEQTLLECNDGNWVKPLYHKVIAV